MAANRGRTSAGRSDKRVSDGLDQGAEPVVGEGLDKSGAGKPSAAKKPAARRRQSSHPQELDATRLYLSEIGFSPLLTAEEEVYYSRRALRGDESARKRMIESNLRLVVKIARRYMNRGLRCWT